MPDILIMPPAFSAAYKTMAAGQTARRDETARQMPCNLCRKDRPEMMNSGSTRRTKVLPMSRTIEFNTPENSCPSWQTTDASNQRIRQR